MSTALWIVAGALALGLFYLFGPCGPIWKESAAQKRCVDRMLMVIPNTMNFDLAFLEEMGFPHRAAIGALEVLYKLHWIEVKAKEVFPPPLKGEHFSEVQIRTLLAAYPFAPGLIRFYDIRIVEHIPRAKMRAMHLARSSPH